MWLFWDFTQCPELYEVSPFWLVEMNYSCLCKLQELFGLFAFQCFISHNTYVGQDLTQGDPSADRLGSLCSSPFQDSVLQILATMDPLNFDFSPLFDKNTS